MELGTFRLKNPNLVQHLVVAGMAKGSVEWWLSNTEESQASSISFTNQCHEAINVAVTYYDGSSWVTKGWWSVKSGKTLNTNLVAKKPREYIYTHADSRNFIWNGSQSNNTVKRSVVSDAFNYKDDGSNLRGSNLKIVGFVRHNVDFDDSVTEIRFNCR